MSERGSDFYAIIIFRVESPETQPYCLDPEKGLKSHMMDS